MQSRNTTKETTFQPLGGALMLAVVLFLFAASVTAIVLAAAHREPAFGIAAGAGLLLFVLLLPGFFVVEPNLGRALVLFGSYRGTVRTAGFWWTNPFTNKKKISLRAYNLNGKTLKVNDLLGNPIEIAAVVVWQVKDSAQALFDVEHFEHFERVAHAHVKWVGVKRLVQQLLSLRLFAQPHERHTQLAARRGQIEIGARFRRIRACEIGDIGARVGRIARAHQRLCCWW